jgi:hypothetical protein
MQYAFPVSDKFPTLYHFDMLLDETINLSTKYVMILGENSWFKILEFL